MTISTYTLDIAYDNNNVLQTRCKGRVIGRVDDNQSIQFVVTRPAAFAEHDLLLFFEGSEGDECHVNLGVGNTYTLERPLTSGRYLSVMPAFCMGDYKRAASTIRFMLGDVLDGSEAPPLPWPDIYRDAPMDGKIYGRQNGQWVEISSTPATTEQYMILGPNGPEEFLVEGAPFYAQKG